MSRRRNPKHTRQIILEAAYNKFLHHGFQAAGLNDVMKATGITKGALYHHFSNKMELGYAVVDEILKPHIENWWLKPLDGVNDPIEGLAHIIQQRMNSDKQMIINLGCPLNTLAQEMSSVDRGFRQRLELIYRLWRKGMARALTRGQMHGHIGGHVEVDEAAAFIIAALQGALLQAKTAQSLEPFHACMGGLSRYLSTLRICQD